MIHTITLLNEKSLQKLLKIYDNATFEHGSMTNPNNLNDKKIITEKKNLLEISDGEYAKQCQNILSENILRSNDFYDFAMPKTYGSMNFLKYDKGMYYHKHNDYYMMSNFRSDISCTVFLNDPSEYEGGELVITVGNKDIDFKLNAGEAILYPTGLMHKVNPVLSGTRKVIVFWIESAIQDSRIRNIYQDFCLFYTKHKEYITQSEEFANELAALKYNIIRNFLTL